MATSRYVCRSDDTFGRHLFIRAKTDQAGAEGSRERRDGRRVSSADIHSSYRFSLCTKCSVIFVLIYFLVLVFQLFFRFSFSFSFANYFLVFSFVLVLQYFFVLVLVLPTTK